MKGNFKNTLQIAITILGGIIAVGASLWLGVGDERRKIKHLEANALCVLELPANTSSVSGTFTLTQALDKVQVSFHRLRTGEPVALSISGEQGVVGSVSVVNPCHFALGRGLQPGPYRGDLRQATLGTGAVVFIAGGLPAYLTGWQIWSRTYVSLLVLSAIAFPWLRSAASLKIRLLSRVGFHMLLLGFVLIFFYLLFHEGGHALAQLAFANFDLARSDFWGLYGHPHSGGAMAPLKPWQQTVVSCAGPMLPTLVGFALFGVWTLPIGRKLRSLRPWVNLYVSAMVAMLVFSEAVGEPLYLLGFISAEGDLVGQAARAGGPVWAVRSLLAGTCLLSTWILWRVAPEIRKAFLALFRSPIAAEFA